MGVIADDWTTDKILRILRKYYKGKILYTTMGKVKRTKEDRKWSKDVRKRDNNECVICGKTERLNAHHIIPINNKDTRLDLKNGITLCSAHHRFNQKKISAHQHPLAFFKWMIKNRNKQFNYLFEKC